MAWAVAIGQVGVAVVDFAALRHRDAIDGNGAKYMLPYNTTSYYTPTSGGGLGDILGKMGVGADKQSSGGGLGDILGKMGMGSSSKSSGGLLGAIMSIIALATGSIGNKAKTGK